MPTYTRHRMSLDLSSLPPVPENPGGYSINTMEGADSAELASLSIDSYMDTPDWDLVPELQTREGCQAFINKLFSGEDVFDGQEGHFRKDLSFTLSSGGTLCGAVYTLLTHDAAHIIDFAVAPAFRGKGVGRFFLGSVLRKYRDAGYRCAFLLVTAHNDPAVRLYTRLGFSIDSTHTVDIDREAL